MTNKGVIVVGSLVVAGGLVYALTRKAAPLPPGEVNETSTLEIQVYDSAGHLVPHDSPMLFEEGASYTVKLTITNTSTKGGTPWPVSFVVGISAATDLVTLISPREDTINFAAGETKILSYAFNVPMGSGGQAGLISAYVAVGTGGAIASVTQDFAIGTIAIDYGATIVIS